MDNEYVKPMCVICGAVRIDGDVMLDNRSGKFTHWFYFDDKNEGSLITNVLMVNDWRSPRKVPLKIKLLWLWHITILKKEHVYLTGVLRGRKNDRRK